MNPTSHDTLKRQRTPDSTLPESAEKRQRIDVSAHKDVELPAEQSLNHPALYHGHALADLELLPSHAADPAAPEDVFSSSIPSPSHSPVGAHAQLQVAHDSDQPQRISSSPCHAVRLLTLPLLESLVCLEACYACTAKLTSRSLSKS